MNEPMYLYALLSESIWYAKTSNTTISNANAELNFTNKSKANKNPNMPKENIMILGLTFADLGFSNVTAIPAIKKSAIKFKSL